MQETLTLTILILDLECGSKVDLFWTYITTPLCTHRAYVSQMQIPHLNSELGVSGLPAQAVHKLRRGYIRAESTHSDAREHGRRDDYAAQATRYPLSLLWR